MAIGVAHIVSDLSQINFGVWNAALFGSSYLKNKYGVITCVVVGQKEYPNPPLNTVPIIWAGKETSIEKIADGLAALGLHPEETIIVTHGCWLAPTRLGDKLKQVGFRWIYTPHGMLEPWSLAHHRLKKMIYFHLFEKRYIRKADLVRAVSSTEQNNLVHLLKRKVETIENGVSMPAWHRKNDGAPQFLFMARLHFKKGIVPLVKAWTRVMKGAHAKLVIAGPDEGELEKIKPFLNGNIEYVGAIYGAGKTKLLRQTHYYLLPSFSEGFPTTVVEAMSFGAIPVISSGCNFQEVFEHKLGYRVEPDESIEHQLTALKDQPFDHELSKRNYDFIERNYSEQPIGDKLFSLFNSLR